MKLDHASSKPLHVQAEEILRKLIESEEYKNGKFLPNEVDLSERLNISQKKCWHKSCSKRHSRRSKKLVELFTRDEGARYRNT